MHLEWERARRDFFEDESLKKSFQDDPRLTIITYSTDRESSLLERCAAHLGLTLVVLGQRLSGWSWEHKITLVRNYLNSVEPTEYVMCLDAFDTLILACPQEILARFDATSAGILFGGTATDWPPSESHKRFEIDVSQGASPAHRHLNASYIGKATDVLACLDRIERGIGTAATWCHTDSGFDDQLAWREMHLRYHPRLRIDTNCSIFVRFDEDR